MKNILLILSSLIFQYISMAQNNPCSAPETKQFDFWIGEWQLEWNSPDGKIKTGTNTINKILDGCVVQENFSESESQFKGTSVSLYNEKLKKWQQTWVDNAGSYFDFTGGLIDDRMILSKEMKNNKDETIILRMVFYNISKNEFDWNWEKSSGNGDNWILMWHIHYKRKS